MSAETFTPTAPLSDVAIAAMHSLEARLAGLRRGESTVINGTTCTAVSLRDADLLDRYGRVSACCRRKSASAATSADFDGLLAVQDELAACRREVIEAGLLHLVEARSAAAAGVDGVPNPPYDPPAGFSWTEWQS